MQPFGRNRRGSKIGGGQYRTDRQTGQTVGLIACSANRITNGRPKPCRVICTTVSTNSAAYTGIVIMMVINYLILQLSPDRF